MIQFIQPIWLAVSAGVIIPLVIHLWNIQKEKTVKVGSIFLFTARSKQHAKRLQLHDILLLILRSFFILLLALLLAGPSWFNPSANNTSKGWILIEPGSIRKIYPRFRSSIDSMLNAGYEFHYFTPGFEKAKLGTALELPPDSSIQNPHWAVLKLLEQQAPALPIHVFTGNRLSRFAGNRPELSLDLTWHIDTTVAPARAALAAAYLIGSDSIRILRKKNTAVGTKISQVDISATRQRDAAYNVRFDSGKLMVSTPGIATGKAFAGSTIEVDTSTLQVAIYAGNFNVDASYLLAALQAIQQYTSRTINISLVKNVRDIKRGQHWLFWLSEDSVPKDLQVANIFKYEAGELAAVSSNINISGVGTIPLYQLKAARSLATNETPIWEDGFGRSILLATPANNGTVYQFLSRFNPAWNDLVWSGDFPAILWQLMASHDIVNKYDQRIIDTRQLEPVLSPGKNRFKTAGFNHDLSGLTWLAILIVFFLERMISLRHKKELHG